MLSIHRSTRARPTLWRVVVLILGLPVAAAANTELVADLSPGSGAESSNPSPAPLLGALDASEPYYFWASDETSGRELWKTDGTEEGTHRIVDLCPGPCDARAQTTFGGEVRRTTLPGLPLLTIADDGATGYQVWRIDKGDGSSPATVRRLTSLCTTAGSPCDHQLGFTSLALDDGRVVFWVRTAPSGFSDAQAWVTDGTVEGTGPLWGATSPWRNPYQFVRIGNDVFFFADTVAGREVYRTDGSGTTPTLAVGACLEATTSFQVLGRAGDHLVFERDCQGLGQRAEFWTTQGTPETTAPLAPDCFGSCGTVFFRTAESGGRFYFGSGSNLWTTDGTPEGTRPAANLPGELRSSLFPIAGGIAFFVGPADFSSDYALYWIDGSFAANDSPRPLGVSGTYHTTSVGEDQVFFIRSHGPGPKAFVTDGTADGTTPIDLGASSATHPGADGARFYFRGRTSSTGSELWTIAPGADFAEPLADLTGTSAGSRIRNLTDRGPDLLFTAAGVANTTSDIWSTDGTTDGTAPVVGSDSSTPLLSIRDWSLESHRFGDVLFFGASDVASGVEPWLWDGGDARLLADLALDIPANVTPDSFPREPVEFGDRVFFFADQGMGQKIWSTDLTTGGTELLIDIDPTWFNDRFGCGVCSPPSPYPTLFSPIYPRGLTVVGHHMVFSARTDEHGGELWRSDGTSEGTELLLDLLPGEEGSAPSVFRRAGPWIYFLARGADAGPLPHSSIRNIDVWRTDGTAAGTSRLARLPISWSTFVEESEAIQMVAFGTSMALAPGPQPSPFVPRLGSLWIFDAAGGVTEIELARKASDLVAAGDRLYFVSGDAEEGTELWHTDGTAVGTSRFAIRPGPLGSSPRSLVLRDTPEERSLFFGAIGDTDSARRGHELWRLPLDEAYLPAGQPTLAADIRPGPASSSPDQLAFGGSDARLFFEADDGVHGRELWAHDAGTPTERCRSDSHTACIGDRFRLRVTYQATPGGPEERANTVPAGVTSDIDDTVFFTFFSEENLELAIKILDGTTINDHHWIYYGALSDRAYTITAEDLETGTVRVFENPSGTFCGNADVLAFPAAAADEIVADAADGSIEPARLSAPSQQTSATQTPATLDRSLAASESPPGACRDLPGTLCFYDRFEVSASWATAMDAGSATPIPYSSETGMFWFFGEDNVELVVKLLDGTTINGKHWLFYGALSDVEYEIKIYDTVSGTTRVYRNERGNLCGGADVAAL